MCQLYRKPQDEFAKGEAMQLLNMSTSYNIRAVDYIRRYQQKGYCLLSTFFSIKPSLLADKHLHTKKGKTKKKKQGRGSIFRVTQLAGSQELVRGLRFGGIIEHWPCILCSKIALYTLFYTENTVWICISFENLPKMSVFVRGWVKTELLVYHHHNQNQGFLLV